LGKRGPRRLPTSLKLVRGTARGSDKRRREPRPGPIRLRCPRDFPPEARRAFRRLSTILIPLHLLTAADVESYEMMCLHYGLARRAALEMFKAGLTAQDDHDLPRKSPLNQLVKEHSAEFRKYAQRFGMDPSSRAELDVPSTVRSRREILLGSDKDNAAFFDDAFWFDLARQK